MTTASSRLRVAVILPTLNESEFLARALTTLHARGDAALVIVSDCGSTDDTPDIARRHHAHLVHDDSSRSRATAMNAGAHAALQVDPPPDVLLFLHADSIPPEAWDLRIAETLRDDRVVAGAFDFGWEPVPAPWHTRSLLWQAATINRIRFRITRSYFGDQGIFVRRAPFEAVHGYADVRLLEDVRLCRDLRRLGRLRLAPAVMLTSPRRFLSHGTFTQSLIDLALLTLERLGVRPTRIYDWYNRTK